MLDCILSYLYYVLSSYIAPLTDLFARHHDYILKIITLDNVTGEYN